MSLRNEFERKMLADHFKKSEQYLEHNSKLFNIYEGDLLSYVLEDLQSQLSQKSFDQVKHRVAPINVLKRVVGKLGKCYSKPPVREIQGANDSDKELWSYYCESFDIDTWFTVANHFFNLFKTTAIEPFLEDGKPRLRAIPSNQFLVYSNNRVNPTRPTHFIKIMGKFNDGSGKESTLLYVYTKDEFIPMTDDGVVVTDILNQLDNPEGVNLVGRLPIVYVNRSRTSLVPKIDSDTLTMTKLFPVLLSDLNFALMYQCFSIIYGIDLDQEGLKMAPNAFWNFKTDPERETKPEIGVIKPQVDSDKALSLVKALLSMWLETKNIKPGAMGDLTVENLASGVAKIIDESDTSEDRQEQVQFFKAAEEDLADLVINHLHPIWSEDPAFEKKFAFTPGISVKVTFPIQRPNVDSSKAIDDQKKKIDMRIQSRKGALKELNPDWTDEQVEEKLKEVDEENPNPEPTNSIEDKGREAQAE